MTKLSKTMDAGLRKMASRLRRDGPGAYTMSEPNENTGKALARRGLIVEVGGFHAWPQYRLTNAGWEYIATHAPPSQEERHE